MGEERKLYPTKVEAARLATIATFKRRILGDVRAMIHSGSTADDVARFLTDAAVAVRAKNYAAGGTYLIAVTLTRRSVTPI